MSNFYTEEIAWYRQVLQRAVEVDYYRAGAEQLLAELQAAETNYVSIRLAKLLEGFASSFVADRPADRELDQILQGLGATPSSTPILWARLQSFLKELDTQLSSAPKETKKDETIRRLSDKVKGLLHDVTGPAALMYQMGFGREVSLFKEFAKKASMGRILFYLLSGEEGQGFSDKPARTTVDRLVREGYLDATRQPTEKVASWSGVQRMVEIAREAGVRRFFGLRIGRWITWPRPLDIYASPQPANNGVEFFLRYFCETQSEGSPRGRILDLLGNGATLDDQLELLRARRLSPKEVAGHLLNQRDRYRLAIRWLSMEPPEIRTQILEHFTVRGKSSPSSLRVVYNTLWRRPVHQRLQIDLEEITREELTRKLETLPNPSATPSPIPRHGRRLRSVWVTRPPEGHHRVMRRMASGAIVVEPTERESRIPRAFVDPKSGAIPLSEMNLGTNSPQMSAGMRSVAGGVAILELAKILLEGTAVIAAHHKLSTTLLGLEDPSDHGLYYPIEKLYYLTLHQDGMHYQIPRVADQKNVESLLKAFLRDDPHFRNADQSTRRQYFADFSRSYKQEGAVPAEWMSLFWSSPALSVQRWLGALGWRHADLVALVKPS